MKSELIESRFDRLFRKTRELCTESGIDTFYASASQYDLILESGLHFAVGEVLFPVMHHKEDRYMTEIRLHKEDIFVFDQWGLYLLNAEGPYDTQFTEHTFPDSKFFNDRESSEAGIFYNAKMSLVINNMVVLTDISTDIFRMDIRDTEKEIHELSDFRYLDMPIMLQGNRNIYFRLDFPRKTNWTESGTRLRLRLRGLLVRNATIGK